MKGFLYTAAMMNFLCTLNDAADEKMKTVNILLCILCMVLGANSEVREK